MNQNIGLIVPTFNAGHRWEDWLRRVGEQSIRIKRRLVIDSSSTDRTAELARQYGLEVVSIQKAAFNHGGTRQKAALLLDDCSILVFLTQDALLASKDAIEILIEAFEDPNVAMVYGRQLPHEDANPIAAHARLFNYPNNSETRTVNDIPHLGIRAAFCSNSFSAVRRSDLISSGGFSDNLILGEDTHLALRLLLNGKSLRYVSDAAVFHSHNYTLAEDFKRYFDTGVFHLNEHWILERVGKIEGEGFRFVKSEIHYLFKHSPLRIPESIVRTTLKLLAYKIGKRSDKLSLRQKRMMSMHRGYWESPKGI